MSGTKNIRKLDHLVFVWSFLAQIMGSFRMVDHPFKHLKAGQMFPAKLDHFIMKKYIITLLNGLGYSQPFEKRTNCPSFRMAMAANFVF